MIRSISHKITRRFISNVKILSVLDSLDYLFTRFCGFSFIRYGTFKGQKKAMDYMAKGTYKILITNAVQSEKYVFNVESINTKRIKLGLMPYPIEGIIVPWYKFGEIQFYDSFNEAMFNKINEENEKL
jgi:hypothetical protein